MARYIWTVPRSIEVRQEFGADPASEYNPPGGHTGIDFGTPLGTPLFAPAAGVIEYAQWFTTDSGSDNPYWITNGGGISVVLGCDGDDAPSFVFSHLSRTDKNRGDRVKQGDIIGYSGNTGKWTTGPHCHFEAIPPGYNLNSPTYGRVNPARYCTGYWSGTATQGNKPTPIPPSTEEGFLMALSDAEQKLALALLKQIAGYTDMKTSAVAGKVWSTPVVGRPGGPVSALQELADVKTKVLGLEPVITSIAEQTDPARIAEMIPTDIAAQVMAALSAKLAEGAK